MVKRLLNETSFQVHQHKESFVFSGYCQTKKERKVSKRKTSQVPQTPSFGQFQVSWRTFQYIYLTLQHFTPNPQNLYRDISQISLTLCNSTGRVGSKNPSWNYYKSFSNFGCICKICKLHKHEQICWYLFQSKYHDTTHLEYWLELPGRWQWYLLLHKQWYGGF